MLKILLDFLRAAVVMPVPKGITPDQPGIYGLIGLTANVNAAVRNRSSTITSTATSFFLTANQFAAGLLTFDGVAGGGVTARTPSAAQIIAFFGAAVPVDGTFGSKVRVQNSSGQTITVTASTGITLTGTMTIADGKMRDFLIIPTGANAVTIRNAGVMDV